MATYPIGLSSVAVVHRPFGAANLRELRVASRDLCHIHVLMAAETAKEFPDFASAAASFFPTTIFAPGDLTTTVRELGPDALVTFHDAELDGVDRTLADLSMIGRPMVEAPWDKLQQRTILRDAGLSGLEFAPVDSPQSFVRACRMVGLPAVLKPRRGVGGAGIAFIENQLDIEYQLHHRQEWADLLLESFIPESAHPSGIEWLADFVSVETVSSVHSRRHLAIFDKAPVSRVRHGGDAGADAVSVTGDIFPSRLPPHVQNAVLDKTSAILDALKVTSRVTHTEVRLSAAGPELIEVNGRMGGHLSRLLKKLGEGDLVKAALLTALGRSAPRTEPGTEGRFSMGIFMNFPQRDGTVRSQVTRAQILALPGVVGVDELARFGDRRSDTSHRAANLVLTASSAEELDRVVPQAARGLAQLFATDGLDSHQWLTRFTQSAPE